MSHWGALWVYVQAQCYSERVALQGWVMAGRDGCPWGGSRQVKGSTALQERSTDAAGTGMPLGQMTAAEQCPEGLAVAGASAVKGDSGST